MARTDYSAETELIYRAECMECEAWFMPPHDSEADDRAGLRRAKAWAAHHLADEHGGLAEAAAADAAAHPEWGRDDDTEVSLFVQILRVIGNVA